VSPLGLIINSIFLKEILKKRETDFFINAEMDPNIWANFIFFFVTKNLSKITPFGANLVENLQKHIILCKILNNRIYNCNIDFGTFWFKTNVIFTPELNFY